MERIRDREVEEEVKELITKLIKQEESMRKESSNLSDVRTRILSALCRVLISVLFRTSSSSLLLVPQVHRS